ncbi:MAG: thiamine pyrophosphate-binding protein [Syntrophobacteraceae bacterium]|jgi:acetolactate synthase-1/2/3 large subunit
MPDVRVADAMAKFLEEAGVEYAFGFNGHGNWAILDAIKYNTQIQGIMARREDHAVHMADGYWRVKRQGAPALAVTTVGPGNMNIPSALANAFYDSMAMLVIAGGGPTQWYGTGCLEECYRYRPEGWTDVVRPICKAAWTVERPDTAVEMLARAFKLTTAGRPGPVVLQVPFDLQHEKIPMDNALLASMYTSNIVNKARPDAVALEKAAELIRKAKKPLVLAGGGVLNANGATELREFVEKYKLPVMTTFMAKGAVPESNPLSLGAAGMCGTWHAYCAAGECDVLLAFGARFNDCHTAAWRMYAGIPNKTKLIHIDIDQDEIGRNYPTEIGIVADAAVAIKDMSAALSGMKPLDTNGDWWKQIKKWETENTERKKGAIESDWVPVHYATLFDKVSRVINEVDPQASVMFDTGNSQSFAPNFFQSNSPHVSTNGQFAQMGFNVPAAIGAKCANPNNLSIGIGGDGSFFMTTLAVASAVQYNIPVVWIVFNNQSLLMETELMMDFYGRETFTVYNKEPLDLTKKGKKTVSVGEAWNPDIVELSKSLGAKAETIVKPEEIEPALRRAIQANEPYVLDVWVNRQTKGWYNIPFYFPAEYRDRGKPNPFLPPHGNIYKNKP